MLHSFSNSSADISLAPEPTAMNGYHKNCAAHIRNWSLIQSKHHIAVLMDIKVFLVTKKD